MELNGGSMPLYFAEWLHWIALPGFDLCLYYREKNAVKCVSHHALSSVPYTLTKIIVEIFYVWVNKVNDLNHKINEKRDVNSALLKHWSVIF